MATQMRRTDWTSHALPDDLVTLDPELVEGVVLHWPGTTRKAFGADRGVVVRHLEAYRRDHVNRHGWDDIAYQVAVDQAGRIWPLRGLRYRSAANGTVELNRTLVAILLVIGGEEEPSAEMLNAARDVIVEARALYPRAGRIVGHQSVRPRPTNCPGDRVMALIKSGAFEPRDTDVSRDHHRPYFTLGRILKVDSPPMHGTAVLAVQRRLLDLRYHLPRWGADGIYGWETADAVRTFQRRKHLSDDGRVGHDTTVALGGRWTGKK